MRRYLLAAFGLCFIAASSEAGFLLALEPMAFVPKDGKTAALSFDQFRLKLSDIVGAAVPTVPSELRTKYQTTIEELQARRRRLTADELNTLGGCYYRLNDFDRAFEAWREASGKDPRNFLAHSQLSLYYQVQGEFLRARQYLDDAQRLRPKQLPGLTAEQTGWFLKVEDKRREILRVRRQERRDEIALASLPPDDLFGVQFVGPSGSFEAGTMAPEQAGKLSEDAIAIVQQLLLWTPHDARLLWLLAELYNAQGEMGAAVTLMNECMDARRFQTDALKEHRRLIQERIDQLNEAEAQKDFRKHPQIVWTVGIIGGALILALALWQIRIMVQKVV